MQAFKVRRKVIVTYFSGDYNLNLTKLCVPLRYASPDAEGDESDCYYFWDSKEEVGKRVLGLRPSEIIYIELGDETFDPDEYIVPVGD